MRVTSSANPRHNLQPCGDPLWERACSRLRTDIQHSCRQIHRYREQARSHRFDERLTKCVHTNVTISASCVCTSCFCAPKSYILLS
ncbi:hypothetical protein FQ185_27695 [Pseudomonas sp. ANT_H12B]|nr:hypothetical protein FQ185_27695 [Pseudomonas sp. ANT_H12B]